MAFKWGLVGNVFFVRWITMESGDSSEILNHVRRSRRELSRALVYIAIAPEELPPPGQTIRDEVSGIIEPLFDSCSSVHLVIEGKGFRYTVMRSIVAGMHLLAGGKGRRLSAHENVPQALESVASTLPMPVEQIISRGRTLGLVT